MKEKEKIARMKQVVPKNFKKMMNKERKDVGKSKNRQLLKKMIQKVKEMPKFSDDDEEEKITLDTHSLYIPLVEDEENCWKALRRVWKNIICPPVKKKKSKINGMLLYIK